MENASVHPSGALANRFRAEVEQPDTLRAVAGLVMDAWKYLRVVRSARLVSSTAHEPDVVGPGGVFSGPIPVPGPLVPFEIGLSPFVVARTTCRL